jgi:hypothetical protein
MVLMGHRRLIGLVFPGAVPEGWRGESNWAVPAARTRLGREIKKELEALPVGIGSWSFSDLLGPAYTAYSGNQVLWTAFVRYGDKVILSIPSSCGIFPEGCTELRISEKWKIVEEHRAAVELEKEAA